MDIYKLDADELARGLAQRVIEKGVTDEHMWTCVRFSQQFRLSTGQRAVSFPWAIFGTGMECARISRTPWLSDDGKEPLVQSFWPSDAQYPTTRAVPHAQMQDLLEMVRIVQRTLRVLIEEHQIGPESSALEKLLSDLRLAVREFEIMEMHG